MLIVYSDVWTLIQSLISRWTMRLWLPCWLILSTALQMMKITALHNLNMIRQLTPHSLVLK